MGLVKFGGGVAQISGKVGGTVFAKTRFGHVARNFSTPVNPQSSRQGVARARVADLASAWNEVLTQAQRNAWDQYGANVPMLNRLGETIYLTGFNHYLRSNCAIRAAGGVDVDAAPGVYTLPSVDDSLSVSISEATQLLSVAFDDSRDWLGEDGGHMLIAMGLPKNNSVKFFGGPYRVAGSIDGDSTTPPTTPTTIAVPFGVVENQKVWIQARILRADGRVSSFFRDDCICGA